jgi:multimeric flavodoxin WrbA
LKKVLVAFFSHSGKTEQMAEYITEGIRISGQQAETKNIANIKTVEDLQGYDGYIFGAPTYSLDTPGPMKTFLSRCLQANLKGKLSGAFGSYRHEVGYQPSDAGATNIFQFMQDKYDMIPFELGTLSLKEETIDTIEGMRACQDYGKVFGQKLGP